MRINTGLGQWLGIALLLVTCGVLGFALPRYAEGTESSNVQITEVAAGETVSEGPVSMTPADGWSRSTEVPGILLLKKGDATMIIDPPAAATGDSMTDVVSASIQKFTDDAEVHYDFGDPQPFTTTSGLDGAKALVASPSGTTVLAAVTDGQQTVTVNLDAGAKAWAGVREDVDPMLESMDIGPAGGASGTENG